MHAYCPVSEIQLRVKQIQHDSFKYTLTVLFFVQLFENTWCLTIGQYISFECLFMSNNNVEKLSIVQVKLLRKVETIQSMNFDTDIHKGSSSFSSALMA